MDELYAPWRMEWVRRDDREVEFDGCVFCELPRQQDDETHRILARSGHAYVVLNKAPYCPGHVLVVAFDHVETYAELAAPALVDLSKLLQTTTDVVRGSLHPDGMNVGMNLGCAGGASVPGHLHVHVVPRWTSDTTFMPVVGDAKVLPEALDDTYHRLRDAFADVDGVSDDGSSDAVTLRPTD
jgi:ATP adenylyltransferase